MGKPIRKLIIEGNGMNKPIRKLIKSKMPSSGMHTPIKKLIIKGKKDYV